ncbi:MAG: InlB B-repeat-containing protein, partial [Methanocorpusculum sp.]|nr:InlB B-repeat-containing protein [Methanocorpusculum sp.]
LVNGDIVTDGTKDNINGEDVSVSQIWAFVNSIPTFWSALGFTGTNWEVNTTNDKYKLPVLKNSGTSGLDASYLIFRAGKGTDSEPYQIKYAYELKTLANLTNNDIGDKVNNPGTKYSALNYKLMNDIDLSSVCGADIGSSGISWTPIGTSESLKFEGNFNGGNHTISNLYINNPNSDYQGLFGYTENSEIKNIGLININVSGAQFVGGLVGFNKGDSDDNKIENCYATGKVTGAKNVGGLVGENNEGKSIIINSYADVTVKGTESSDDRIGGFVGNNYKGTIESCSAAGNVSGYENVGGFAGQNENSGTIVNCSAAGNVTGNSNIGGLVGQNEQGTVQNSVALNPSVTGDSNVSRVVGYNKEGTINYCYAWEGILNRDGNLFQDLTPNLTSVDVWNKLSTFEAKGFSSDIWVINLTNKKYLLPVLTNLDNTEGLDASHLIPLNISFDKNGGAGEMTNQTLSKNVPADIKINSFTKTGYTFAGWAETAGGAIVYENGGSIKITEDKKLYANWTANSYNVTFNPNNLSDSWNVTVTHGNKVDEPTPEPTKENYKFVGWNNTTTGNLFDFTNTVITSDTEIIANFTLNSYNVTFVANNGTSTEWNVTVTHGQKVNKPTDPDCIGHRFIGWNTIGGAEWNFDTNEVTQDTRLIGNFTLNNYNVTFVANNGTAAKWNVSVP